MRVLVTGPSCAGKTTWSRRQPVELRIALDRVERVGELGGLLADAGPGDVLFDGLPSGSDGEIARFLAAVDEVVLVSAPFSVRLERMLERDGPGALGRFLYNEFAWHRYLEPLIVARPVRRVDGTEAAAPAPPDSVHHPETDERSAPRSTTARR